MRILNVLRLATKVVTVLSVVIVLGSCVGHQAKLQTKYQRGIADLLSVNQSKYDLLMTILGELEDNNDCVEYEDADELGLDELVEIMSALPEDDSNIDYDKSKYLIIRSSNSSSRHTEWWETLIEEDYENKIVENKQMLKRYLDDLDFIVQRHLDPVEYFFMVTDRIFVAPKINLKDFEGGYILSHVDVFDAGTNEVVSSFDVAADNSDKVRLVMDNTYLFIDKIESYHKLTSNLYNRLNANIVSAFLQSIE